MEIKPCPFCGELPTFKVYATNQRGCYVCPTSRCPCKSPHGTWFHDAALEIWNHRPADDALRAELEKAQEENLNLQDRLTSAQEEMKGLTGLRDPVFVVEKLREKNRELVELLRNIANVAHHGSLIGFKTEEKAQAEICRLSLPWWDKEECDRLNAKRFGKDPRL